ncbi:MAG: hypothetical protein K8S24_08840 [Candidatus Aegiribacteria sp.]|nr:hypothetical protein [Candidatus Aegiribacteria sp.]
MRVLTIAFVIVLMLPAVVLAWGFHDAMENGSAIVCVTPRSSAMGGVWSLPSSGAASVFLNPAELSLLNGTSINATTAIVQWNSVITGELNYDHYISGNTGAVTIAAGTEISDAVSIGAGISRVSDFNFNGINDILEDIGFQEYKIYAIDFLDSQGSLWEANTGISVIINDWLTAGVSGGIRFGSGSWNLRHNVINPLGVDDTTIVEWEESDFCSHVGILMPFTFGTFGISGTNSTDRYRSRVAVGFQRDFSVLNGGTLGTEIDIQSIEEKNPAVSGRMFACLSGILPNVRSIYSVGFIRASDYQRAALCIGTGASIDFERMNIDLGVSWMSRSRAGFAFNEPLIHNIDDAGTYYSAGLSWRL